jgi:hypothetical protein
VTAWPLAFVFALAFPVRSFSDERPRLSQKVSLPAGLHGVRVSPNGETNAVRYTVAYEAYWWNCVQVRAAELEGRCPSVCSGNAAATRGCTDGATKASSGIDGLLRRFSTEQVQQYLRTLALEPAGKVKMKGYFTDGPRAEKAPE